MSTYYLKRKFFFTYLLSILPIIIFVFFIFDNWTDNRRQTFLQKNLQLATTISSLNEHFLDGISSTGFAFANNPNIMELKKDETTMFFAQSLSNLPLIRSIFLVDKNGNPVTSAKNSSQNPILISISKESYFKELLSTNKPVISNLIINSLSEIPTVVVASPVFSKNNELVGAIILEANLHLLKDDIERSAQIDKATNIFILDKNKEIIFKNGKNNLTPKEHQAFQTTREIVTIANAKETVFDGYKNILLPNSSSGTAVFNKKYGWITIVLNPLEKQFAPVIQLQRLFILVIVLSLAFITFLLTYFIRKFLSFI